MGFFTELASADNSQIHTPNIILMAIGILLMLLSVTLIVYHCFIHHKGIDGDTVKLILGLLGGGVLNAGASYFSKTVTSNVTAVGRMPRPDAPPATRKIPESEGET
jgi:hypothetical protein